MDEVIAERCANCGRRLPVAALVADYTPDTHFTAERIDWWCRDEATCQRVADERLHAEEDAMDEHGKLAFLTERLYEIDSALAAASVGVETASRTSVLTALARAMDELEGVRELVRQTLDEADEGF